MHSAHTNIQPDSGKKLAMHQRLQGRLLLYLLLPALFIFGCTFVFWGNQALSNALNSATTDLMQHTRLLAKELERSNELALKTAHTMALAQQTALFGQRAASNRYAKSVLQQNPTFVGAYFGYEPDADNNDGLSQQNPDPELAAALDKAGRFIPYWHRSRSAGGDIKLEPLVDMETSDYYQGPKRLALAGKPHSGTITEPYWYEGVQIVEFTYPIVIDGKFKGIAGVDMALASIMQQLPKPDADTELLVLSGQKKVVGASKAVEFMTMPIEQTTYKELVYLLAAKPQQVLTYQLANDSEKLYSADFLPSSNWMVIVGRDKKAILNPIYRQFSMLLLAALTAFSIVTAVAIWFTRRLNLRVQSCVEVLKDLATGTMDTDLKQQQRSTDEIGVMYQHFRLLIDAGKSFEQQCQRIASGDFSTRVMPRGPEDSLANAINKMADQRQQAEQSLRLQTEQLLHAQRELVESEKLASLGTLVVGVAHEVNTPVGVAVTAASHMVEVCSRIKTQTEKHQLKRSELQTALKELELGGLIVCNNLQRAADLIRSFKSVAVDQASGEERQVVISTYLTDVLKGFLHQLKNTAIEVAIQGDNSEPAVHTDPGVLAQIFSNLLMNSVIHGFRNGTLAGVVSSQIHVTDTEVDWSYSDNGCGMPPQVLAKVFDPFFTTNRAGGGSGLGMHIVYNLVVHKLKGKISCESKPGEGTKFNIRFPLQKLQAQSNAVA